MNTQKQKSIRRNRRRRGIRKRIVGTPDRPRLSVYRSLNHVYAQVVDDLAGATICAASTRDGSIKFDGGTGNVAAAKAVGGAIAERAKEKGIGSVAFDRGGFRYQGRIKALADAAREGGLQF